MALKWPADLHRFVHVRVCVLISYTYLPIQHVASGSAARAFMSFNTCYTDTGLWLVMYFLFDPFVFFVRGIYFVADRMHLDDFVWKVQEEW